MMKPTRRDAALYPVSHRFDRRTFLQATGALLIAPALGIPAYARPRFTSDPFTLGVASGAPVADGVVLWTRLAPDPLSGGGLDPVAIATNWEVATDEAFRNVVRHGTTNAEPQYGHSVHTEVDGLQPDRWYWYRFTAGDAVSPVGRTRTAPALDVLGGLRFAFASCQQYEQGYFIAHKHMAEEELDLVVFLGDYIYESSWGRNHVRKHEAGEPYTLEQYRNRYAHYKSDPHLQRCHARFPWIVTWDDHEVSNDYASDRSQHLDPDFLTRRAAAYQAFYEHMPLRASARPQGPNMRLYGHHDFGRLARFYLLDDRQYRSHQACSRPGKGGSGIVQKCAELLDKRRTLLGAEQEAWLGDSLVHSHTHWNIVAQQTLMAQMNRGTTGKSAQFWTDSWDGYPLARQRLLSHIAQHQTTNPLVIGGDVHATFVCDLKTDFHNPRSPVVATEFCGTSLTSQGPKQEQLDAWLPNNPHVKFARGDKRGYLTVELSERRAHVRLRALESEKNPTSSISTLASFVIKSGRAGAEQV